MKTFAIALGIFCFFFATLLIIFGQKDWIDYTLAFCLYALCIVVYNMNKNARKSKRDYY